VYLALNVTQRTAGALNAQAINSGVKLDMGAGEKITCLFDGTNSFNRSGYSIEQKMKVENISYLFIEIKIGCLFGVPAQPLVGLQLIDSYGSFSNYYKFPLAAETTTSTTKPTPTKPLPTQKPVLYKIKFDSNGGTGGKTQSLPYGAKPVPPVVNRKGYTFSAWSPQVVAVTGVTTYKAQWLKDKDSATPPPAVPTTSRKTANTSRTNTRPDNPMYTVTNPSPTDETIRNNNEAIIHDEATSSAQIIFDKADGNSQGDVFPQYDIIQKDNNNITKQVAAVVVAVILLSLAAYFFILASKHKTQPKAEAESAKDETDDGEPDDDF
ncbi:MAG TPA: InlB B-repeat-containing protein, partial [Clostridia bacterium]|nr:InlB B-repeat-containing protein [Clostridia bacterium]